MDIFRYEESSRPKYDVTMVGRIRKEFPASRIIVTSAFFQHKRAILEQGANEFVTVPFSYDEMVKAIRKQVRLLRRKAQKAPTLQEQDENTLLAREARLRWTDELYPDGLYLGGTLELTHFFHEAKMAFVNGQFIGAILLASSFVEHRLALHLDSKGAYRAAPPQSLDNLIESLGEEELCQTSLLDMAIRLRDIRNAFTRARPFENEDSLTRKCEASHNDPMTILEEDAREAISIMHRIAFADLH